jgi:hypothetical protein
MKQQDETAKPPKRRPGRPATGRAIGIMVRARADLLAAIDAYRSTFSPVINRPAALRRIAMDYLGRRGLLKK